MIKSITNFLIIFFIFQQLNSQIAQIDPNGYNPFCDETRHILDVLEIPCLDDDTSNLCEGPIVESECLEAINSMPLDKTPGTDGLPIIFYIEFWKDIKV